DEAAFLAAIAEAPDDRATRLVYADWLEERGDPRAELVRIEEERRAVPPYSDRYWSLGPRRLALRAVCDPAWLAALGYDLGPLVFRDGVPDGWRERWRLIRAFTERWHGHALPDVGGHREEVARIERRVGLPLPPSVREWVAYGHDLGEDGFESVTFH